MSCKIQGNNIQLTRGDTLFIKVNVYVTDPETNQITEYQPSDNDVVEFHLKKRWRDDDPILVKQIPSDSLLLYLSSEETAKLEYRTYRYDIQIAFPNGVVDTFITNSPLKISAEIG